MNRNQRIYSILEEKLPNFEIRIKDTSSSHAGHNNFDGLGETHILITLKAKIKMNINRIKIHRLINDNIKKEFENGLHSVEIKINP